MKAKEVLGTPWWFMFPRNRRTGYPEHRSKMSSQEDSVREFIAITDVDGERARFFLESAGWDLQVRVDSPLPWSCVEKLN